jgi:hypothetical protein
MPKYLLEKSLTSNFQTDLAVQNRQITHKSSIKDNYSDFAEAMILKLKSYYSQCERYVNQCLKEFRECLAINEILCSKLSQLIIGEIFLIKKSELSKELERVRSRHLDEHKRVEAERARHEASLKPALGHPNAASELAALNLSEKERQKRNDEDIKTYTSEFRKFVLKFAESFSSELIAKNEFLLLKFDDILTVDEVNRNDTVNEKHSTNELLKRKLMGLSLEDAEPAQLIKRGMGVWKGVERLNLSAAAAAAAGGSASKKQQQRAGSLNLVTITTVKTTLAHRSTEDMCSLYQSEFERLAEENLRKIEASEAELTTSAKKWSEFWEKSIERIHTLHA